jgi:single-strand DNA-binding protein
LAGYNSLTLVGNLTRDPEIRYVANGNAVCKFAIAVNRKQKAKDEVMFVNIVAWERLGEVCNQYLSKGDPVLIHGRLSIRDYVAKDGSKQKAVECVATEMQMLGTKGGGAQSGGTAPASTADREDLYGGGDEMTDEIPF